jgi:hypothetical protein
MAVRRRPAAAGIATFGVGLAAFLLNRCFVVSSIVAQMCRFLFAGVASNDETACYVSRVQSRLFEVSDRQIPAIM